MFSSEFCEISKNIFFYRTPLVAASDFVTEDTEFTGKIVSDFPLVFVLLRKDDIWLMSFKTLARYHL